MELEELEELMRDLLQAIQAMFDGGEEISDELQGAVAQTLEILYSRIEQLKGEAPPEPPEEQPQLQPSMPSSNVEGFAFDDKNGRLYVRFLGKHPNRNGPLYQYDNVPKNIYEIFQKGAIPAKTDGKNKWGRWWKGKYPSMGAAMYHLIRAGGFPYQRVA